MKRADLTVGMTVENKAGNAYMVVDTGGWRNWGGYRLDATGIEYVGIPVRSAARSVPVDGRMGVLVVGKHEIVDLADPTAPKPNWLTGEPMQAHRMYPEGHYWATIRERQAAMEARVEADAHRDRELVEMVNRYWSDVPHLISTAGVTLDGGLLTERERQVLVTLVLAGQNR